MKTTLLIAALFFGQLAVNAQSNELAMSFTTETATPVININTTGPENLTYEITDNAGAPIATGQLNRNSTMAVNVPMGTYTLRINGTQAVTKTVTINETEAVSPISTGTMASAYIIVKMDKDGAFSYNKMLF